MRGSVDVFHCVRVRRSDKHARVSMTNRLLPLALLIGSIAPLPLAIAGGPVVEPGVAFVTEDAVDHNAAIPIAYAAATCGSNTASYLAELLTVFPTNAKVTKHWPD